MEVAVWKLEVYINGAWVDISADVVGSISGNRGIMRNGPLDRTGDPGYLNFAMNNSIANSAGLVGYYSPGHANCWVGWTTGLPVRLNFSYGGYAPYKWYGRIKPNGIEITPGKYGPRDCKISCHDWMAISQAHELKGMDYATDKRVSGALPLVHANMPFSPLDTVYDNGQDVFPTVFDLAKIKTTAYNEYIKLASSEWGYIYPIGDPTGGETLIFEERGKRNYVDTLLLPLSGGWILGHSDLDTGTMLLGHSIGEEVIINGGFDVDDNWSLLAGWSIAGGLAVYTATANALSPDINPLVVGETYTISFDLVITSGNFMVYVNPNIVYTTSVSGNHSVTFVATDPTFALGPQVGNGDGTVDNVTCTVANTTDSADLTDFIMEGTKISYGKTLANRVTTNAYPRTVDPAATTILAVLNKSFSIAPSEVKTGYRLSYKDPNNPSARVSADTSTMTTDAHANYQEDGLGGDATADLTATPVYGTEAAIYTLSNGGSSTIWVTTLSPIGKAVRSYDQISAVQNDTVSQGIHGVIPLSIDLKYQPSANKAQAFGAYALGIESLPHIAIDAAPMIANKTPSSMWTFILGEPGVKVHVEEDQGGVNGEYFIMGYSFEIRPGGIIKWTPVLKADTGFFEFWILEDSALEESTILSLD